jgi:hypothetical protein
MGGCLPWPPYPALPLFVTTDRQTDTTVVFIYRMHESINLYLIQWLFIYTKRKGDWKGKENCSYFQVSRVVLIGLMVSSLCSITCWPFASNIPRYTTHPFHFYLFTFYQPNDSFDFGVSWWINWNSCCQF